MRHRPALPSTELPASWDAAADPSDARSAYPARSTQASRPSRSTTDASPTPCVWAEVASLANDERLLSSRPLLLTDWTIFCPALCCRTPRPGPARFVPCVARRNLVRPTNCRLQRADLSYTLVWSSQVSLPLPRRRSSSLGTTPVFGTSRSVPAFTVHGRSRPSRAFRSSARVAVLTYISLPTAP